MSLVFAYGTLKKGEPNHYMIESGKYGKGHYCGKAVSTKKFPLVIASRHNIPYVLDAAGLGNEIIGEIYK